MSASTAPPNTNPNPTGGPDNNNGSNNNNRNNTNNNGNNNTLDTFMGTNVYLYGFLSTLILIFLVSVAVAYKGYRTRALLRQRIDEALAAGVFIPGVSPDGSPAGRRHRDAAEKPVLSEVWLRRRQAANVGKWDQLQPLSLQPVPQISTTSEPPTPPTLEEWAEQHPFQRGSRSLIFRSRRPPPTASPPPPPHPLSNDNPLRVIGNSVSSIPVPGDGIRQPPTPSSSRPQSSHTPPQPLLASANPQSPNPESQQVVDVPLLLGIIIAMPDPSRPQMSSASPHRSSMTSTKGKERESGSSHDHFHDGEESENGHGELPELVLGYAGVPLVVRPSAPPGPTPAFVSVPSTPRLQANQPSRKPSLRTLGSPSVAAVGS